jgi:hypothetical protein
MNDPRYILVVELGDVRHDELMNFLNLWQPDSLSSLVCGDFKSAFAHPTKGFDEWMIEVHKLGDEIIEVFGEKCWLLFQKPTMALKGCQTDKQVVQKQAGELIKGTKNIPGLSELTNIICQQDPGKNYTYRTIEKWIRSLHPDYTLGKPGRKPKK